MAFIPLADKKRKIKKQRQTGSRSKLMQIPDFIFLCNPALSGSVGLFTFAFGAPPPAYMFFGRFRLMETAAPGHDVLSFVPGKQQVVPP